jgi:hypothetical protein
MGRRVADNGGGVTRFDCPAAWSGVDPPRASWPCSGFRTQARGHRRNCTVALMSRSNDWRSAARPRGSASTEGLVSCNVRVLQPQATGRTRGASHEVKVSRDILLDATARMTRSCSSTDSDNSNPFSTKKTSIAACPIRLFPSTNA